MGHERIGYLPKTNKWREIVQMIGGFSENETLVPEITTKTISTVKHKFKAVEYDASLFAAVKFLVLLSYSCKEEDSIKFLNANNIKLNTNFTVIDLAKTAKEFVNQKVDTKEHAIFSQQSLIDAIANWTERNQTQQINIFDSQTDTLNIWGKAAGGAGFCELSRHFFSNYLKRYLKYFLEREASVAITNINKRQEFSNNINNHIEVISQHAFETSKIAQSFSAAWYNKNTKKDIPTDRQIKSYIAFLFTKINSELLREENK